MFGEVLELFTEMALPWFIIDFNVSFGLVIVDFG